MIEIAAVIPAAGVGRRMQSTVPKQYLVINNKTILEHTIDKLAEIKQISQIVVVVSAEDPYIDSIKLKLPQHVKFVDGGAERVDSVLAGLKQINSNLYTWCLVHDAARPCVLKNDIMNLISNCVSAGYGGLLATPVRDTMKRDTGNAWVKQTEERRGLWHALTPQLFETTKLISAIELGLQAKIEITDEASAMEAAGHAVQLVEADASNIKITRASDLALAEFFLSRTDLIHREKNEN